VLVTPALSAVTCALTALTALMTAPGIRAINSSRAPGAICPPTVNPEKAPAYRSGRWP
jgi:hypothetical protein